MPFLEILLPSGHKDKVEVTNNSSLINVLDEICYKRQLDINFCCLLYNKSKIDLSLKFGQSKLINNSKLQLSVSDVSLTDNVTLEVTIQLSNGIRLTNKFSPNDFLWSILMKSAENNEYQSMIFPQNSNLIPVLSYLHDQFIGEYCMKHTSLASLGFRSGRILLRLEFKEVSTNELKLVQETIDKKLQRVVKVKEVHETIEVAGSSFYHHDQFQFNRESQPTPSAPQTFSEFSPFSMFPQEQELFSDLSTNRVTANRKDEKPPTLGDILGLSLEKDMSMYVRPETEYDFSNFKFPETTIEESNTILTEKRITKEDCTISNKNRESAFYTKKAVSLVVQDEEIPDSFFEVTENDLREIIRTYRQTAESDSPLLTKALKEQMRESQFAKYKRCIIQFHFQDAYILQSVFYPKETIGDLYQFIKSYFQNTRADFYLYTTPPKDVLKNHELVLIKSGLMPMSKVYVSIKAQDLCLGNFDLLITNNDDEDKAKAMVSKWMSEKHNGNDEQKMDNNIVEPGSADQRRNVAPQGSSAKVPKWFKK